MSIDRRQQGTGFAAGAFITTTINSGETAQAALQIAGQTTQIKGLQVVPWPLLAEIGHGGMIHELLHHELPETQACESRSWFPNALSCSLSPTMGHPGGGTSIQAQIVWVSYWCSALLRARPDLLSEHLASCVSTADNVEEQSDCYQIYILMAAIKEVAVFPAGCNETGSILFSVMKIIHRNTHEPDLL